MKKFAWNMLLACGCIAALTGCVSTGTRAVELGEAVTPGTHEHNVVDEVIVLVDVSGSMYGPDKYRLAKELTRSFIASIPNGKYRVGMLSFGGEWTNEWVRVEPQPLDRDLLLSKTAQLNWQRGSTPLPEALAEIQPGIAQRSGHTAVVILSDGGADRVRTMDLATQIKDTHNGDLCIYTVHMGHSGDGCCAAPAKKDDACCKDGHDQPGADCCKEKKDPCCETIRNGSASPDLRVNGHALLSSLSHLTGCGMLWEAEEILSREGMENMVHTIFFGPGEGDEDGDGVPDSIDQCPHTPRGAKADARGCWVISGLNFDFDRAVIKPQYEGLLDEVAKVLLDNNALNININVRIDGHTDSTGSQAYNQKLSERRAAAVREALVKRGVAASRLSTQGFGELKPVATNKTAEGRFLNRRVELTPIQ